MAYFAPAPLFILPRFIPQSKEIISLYCDLFSEWAYSLPYTIDKLKSIILFLFYTHLTSHLPAINTRTTVVLPLTARTMVSHNPKALP